jgi:hypothetical protein
VEESAFNEVLLKYLVGANPKLIMEIDMLVHERSAACADILKFITPRSGCPATLFPADASS